MDPEVRPWKVAFFQMALTRCKSYVNQAKDHAPKNECVDSFFLQYICPTRVVLKEIKTKFDHSLVVIFSSPKKKSLKFYYTNIFFAMGPCLF